jgi:8-oxo-dGTP diphosphatase
MHNLRPLNSTKPDQSQLAILKVMIEKLSSEIIRLHKGISFPGVTTSFLCHDGNGNLFLAQRSKNTRDEHGRWDTGGGGLKHGQSLEANLRREVKEEYGVEPLKTEFIGHMDVFRETEDGQPTHWVAFYFLVLVDRSKVTICEPEMFDDSGWFTLDNLPSPIHSQFPLFMETYGDRMRQMLVRSH